MSGPKVVRIVTREELQAIGRSQLKIVEDSIAAFVKMAKRHDQFNQDAAIELGRRRDSLSDFFARDDWTALQAQSTALVEFLKEEVNRIRTQAVSEAEKKRSKRIRIVAAATSLISAYETSGRIPSTELRKVVVDAESAKESELASLQSILNVAFQELHPITETSAPSKKQRELAALLGEGEKNQTFLEWLESQTFDSKESFDPRLSSLLAEIEAFDGQGANQHFMDRVHIISGEPVFNRRALLTDSLVLDLSTHCRLRRERESLETKLREVRSSLSVIDSSIARQFVLNITNALESFEIITCEHLLRESKVALEAEANALAASARRRAVLEGLAHLGYEVKEQMATAWVKEGRVVVTKPGTADYGVEFGAPANASRMQVRLVGSDRPLAPRDTRRDTDMETIWCTEFQELKKRLSADGTNLVIERAVGGGIQPVKTVSIDTVGRINQVDSKGQNSASRSAP